VASVLKRELLFWLIAMAVMAGYIALGPQLAPVVPPEPESESGRVLTMDEAVTLFAQRRERREASQRRNEFLRDWYRWGAAVGIGLVLVYTWLHPPWRAADAGKPPRRDQRGKTDSRLPVSPQALIAMAAALLLIIVGMVLIAALVP
jgi:hypothetical protein